MDFIGFIRALLTPSIVGGESFESGKCRINYDITVKCMVLNNEHYIFRQTIVKDFFVGQKMELKAEASERD